MRPALLLILPVVAATGCHEGDTPKPGSIESARWVDQFVASDNGETVRVIGTIAEPITTADQTKNVMFWLAHGGARLRVIYRGTLPGRFRVGWEAAAVGRWRTGDAAQRALADHEFSSAEAGGVFVAADLAAYVPRF